MNYFAPHTSAIQPRGRYMLLSLLLLLYANCALAQQPNPAIFRGLENVVAEKRVAQAQLLYRENFRRVGSSQAMRALDTLQSVARKLEDKPLEGEVYIFRADYYSVNKGFNALSSRYHQQAVAFAIEHGLLLQQGVYLHKMAYYHFVYSHNTEACRQFLEAYEKFKEYGFKNVPDISQYLAEQASFFYNLKDWDNAESLLQQALKYPSATPRALGSINNSIGLIYRGRQEFKTALRYFDRTLKIAQSAKDSAWIGIATGNIGSVYFLQADYAKALPLITADYRISLRYADSINAGLALLRIIRINIERNKVSLAQLQLDTAARLTTNRGYKMNLVSLSEIYQLRSLIFQKNGMLQQALDYRKRYEATKDSLARRDNIAAVENVMLKWEIENHREQITQLKDNMQAGKFKRNAIIFILFLVGVIFLLLFNRHRLKAAKDQQLLLAEKRRVDEELASAAQSLKLYTENLRKNNLLVEKFRTELTQIKAQNDKAGSLHLEQLLNARLMTAEAWDEFKRLFVRVHSNFFDNLRKTYPKLTDTDTRLLSLIKLGLNNREMSNMLGVTIEGIKKSKQRLRKKMDLQPEQDIEQVVAVL